MKGAVAAMLLAFRDAGPTDGCVFASFVSEETGGRGAQHAIENGFAPERAIVGEGSTSYSAEGIVDVAVAHKGRRGSTITVAGEAAHASEEAEGENAIHRACEVIGDIRSLAVPEADVMGESIEGSVVVTEINGGSAWNIVPEECWLTIDERTVPGERAAIESVTEHEWVSWTVDQDLPPMACRDSEFVEMVHRCVNAVTGGSALVSKPHATDAGWLSFAGVSCLVCGPAEPGEAHTASESVSLPVLGDCYEIYRGIIDRCTDIEADPAEEVGE
jgi:acetylornithine deacetylase